MAIKTPVLNVYHGHRQRKSFKTLLNFRYLLFSYHLEKMAQVRFLAGKMNFGKNPSLKKAPKVKILAQTTIE